MSTPEDIQRDIEKQREHLAETVDQLAAKLDVKAQAKQRISDARDAATTDDGKPRPELLAAAGALVVAFVVVVVLRRR